MKPGLVLLLIVVIALVNLVLGGVLLVRRGISKRVAQRLADAPGSHGDPADPASMLRRKNPNQTGWLGGAFSSSPIQRLERLLKTAGMERTPQQIIIVMAALSAVFFLAALIKLKLALAAIVGIVLGVALPIFVIRRIRASRYARIAAQLPDAVDMLARSLKAGHPVPTGIGMIAHEVADPIGAEFRLVHEEMTYGLDLKDALGKMGERVAIPEVTYMIVAMRIQAGTGGSLAEILNSLASVIRARQNLFAKVKALSAESRFAGKILGAMPFGVVCVLLLMNPHYYDEAWHSTGLAITLGVAGFMSVVGVLLMRKVVNIRV
jgi:tight adherence protein B